MHSIVLCRPLHARGMALLEAFDGTLDPGFVVNPETPPNRRNAWRPFP